MFNFDEELKLSVNQNVVLPDGQWAEQSMVMFDADDTIRVIVKMYYHVESTTTDDDKPFAIDMEIIRNGMSPLYKDFVNFNGAWRDESGRYSTNINDLLPFGEVEFLSTGEDQPLFLFEIKLNELEVSDGN